MMQPIHGALKLNALKCSYILIEIAHNVLGNPKLWKISKFNFRKDVSLPTALQRAMATEAEASREARAKVIAAEGEMKSSLALKQASDIMCKSPAALQLRYLQTLNSIASEKNSTIIFPLPLDMLRGFFADK